MGGREVPAAPDKCWGALLPVRTQAQLLWARLRGRFRYADGPRLCLSRCETYRRPHGT